MFEKLKKDSYEYKGWLRSDHLVKRALAVVGHNFVGVLMIYAAIFGGIVALSFIFLILSAIMQVIT